MLDRLFSAGLSVAAGRQAIATQPLLTAPTEEAALVPARGAEMRVVPLAAVDDIVSQGQPLLKLRNDQEITLVAPMAARIAAIELKPGRRLTQLILFREASGDRYRFETSGAETDASSLRKLIKNAGLWPRFCSRPFGHVPGSEEVPFALVVMAADSRPGAPSPRLALEGREPALERGLAALTLMCAGPVFLCESREAPIGLALPDGVKLSRCGALHPQGMAGFQVHRLCPVEIERRVWDIHAEDVADLGELLATGFLPETRLVSVTGSALTEPRLVRCQPGADLRGLCHGFVRPGPHQVIAGSVLDGHAAHWLGPRDRQVTVLPHGAGHRRGHWFSAALTKAARPLPIIPTAALEQALGGDMPAAALVRAISSGDQEAAVKLGALSLLEDDLALADYVTAAEPGLGASLRAIFNRIEAEEVPA